MGERHAQPVLGHIPQQSPSLLTKKVYSIKRPMVDSSADIEENQNARRPELTSDKLRWDADLTWKWWTQSKENKKQGINRFLIEIFMQEALKSCTDASKSTDHEWLTSAVYPTDGELGGLASLVYEEDGGYKLLRALDENSDQDHGEELAIFKSLNVKG